MAPRRSMGIHTDEVAVMLDTKSPLDVTLAADAVARGDRCKSWSR